MKTTTKHQSFLATSSRKYFKIGLAGSILFSIAAFELPIYAGTPNFNRQNPSEDTEVMLISEIVPIKETPPPAKKVVVQAKSPVAQLILNNDPIPTPEPEPKKIEPLTVSSNVKQIIQVDPTPPPSKKWEVVEIMPEFKGGLEEMYKYFGKNIRYSEKAKYFNLEGKVWVRFVVDPEGNIKDVEIAKGVDPLLDDEALRVVKNMPQWNPGIQNGNKVNVVMVLPINFVLQQ